MTLDDKSIDFSQILNKLSYLSFFFIKFSSFFSTEICALQGDLVGMKTPWFFKERMTGQMPSSASQASGYWGTAGNA